MKNLAFYIGAQSGVTTCAEGEPGGSKTRSIEAFIRKMGRLSVTVHASMYPPEEINGVQHIVTLPGAPPELRMIIPEWQAMCEAAPNGAGALLDEAKNTCPAGQAALLRKLDRGVDNTMLMGATNPVEQSTNGYDFSAAVVNRLYMHQWEQDRQAWSMAMLTGQWPEVDYPILPADWEKLIPMAGAIVVSFINARPHMWQCYPKNRADEGQPWPSQRSWTNLIRLRAAGQSVGANEEVLNAFATGTVGAAAAVEFRTFAQYQDLIDPETLLAKPGSYKAPSTPDKVFATLGAVAAAVVSNLTQDRWIAGCDVMVAAAKNHEDIATANLAPIFECHKRLPYFQIPTHIVKRFGPLCNRVFGV